jgi:propanediol dehydratase large subunit
MSIAKLHTFGVSILISVAFLTIISILIQTKADKATYTIISENGETYYTNSFRMYGKGIVFTDAYDRTVIIQGDLEIIKKPEKK